MGMESDFTFEGTGTIYKIDTFTTKNGKDIVTLVFKIDGEYPKFIPIKFFGRLAGRAKEMVVGDIVTVSGHLGGREWNGKYYADNAGDSLEVAAKAKQEGNIPQKEQTQDDSLPF